MFVFAVISALGVRGSNGKDILGVMAVHAAVLVVLVGLSMSVTSTV